MPKKNINIQNKHIRECNWINKKHIFTKIFHEESNDWIKNMCHRARFFVLVTFLKNPEKNKDYNKCFNQFFCLSTPYIYHWAET